MPVDYEYVSLWDCCVSDKQNNWQQPIQSCLCDRANRNGRVLFLKSSLVLDGHMCDQSGENGGFFGLMQVGRLVERSVVRFWDFHASGKGCRDGLSAHQKNSTSSIHCEGEPVSGTGRMRLLAYPSQNLINTIIGCLCFLWIDCWNFITGCAAFARIAMGKNS